MCECECVCVGGRKRSGRGWERSGSERGQAGGSSQRLQATCAAAGACQGALPRGRRWVLQIGATGAAAAARASGASERLLATLTAGIKVFGGPLSGLLDGAGCGEGKRAAEGVREGVPNPRARRVGLDPELAIPRRVTLPRDAPPLTLPGVHNVGSRELLRRGLWGAEGSVASQIRARLECMARQPRSAAGAR